MEIFSARHLTFLRHLSPVGTRSRSLLWRQPHLFCTEYCGATGNTRNNSTFPVAGMLASGILGTPSLSCSGYSGVTGRTRNNLTFPVDLQLHREDGVLRQGLVLVRLLHLLEAAGVGDVLAQLVRGLHAQKLGQSPDGLHGVLRKEGTASSRSLLSVYVIINAYCVSVSY